MATEQEKREFGRVKKYGIRANEKPQKAKHGKLIAKVGNVETVLHEDKPFALLQFLKKQLIESQSYLPKQLIIRY